MLSDGSLRYDGRTDSQIKIRGHRVDLTEIERQLLMIATERRPVSGHADADDDDEAVPQIDKGLVLCHRAGEIDQALVAFVTLRNGDDGGPPDVVGAETAAQRIEAALAGRLADYMVPQVRYFVCFSCEFSVYVVFFFIFPGIQSCDVRVNCW